MPLLVETLACDHRPPLTAAPRHLPITARSIVTSRRRRTTWDAVSPQADTIRAPSPPLSPHHDTATTAVAVPVSSDGERARRVSQAKYPTGGVPGRPDARAVSAAKAKVGTQAGALLNEARKFADRVTVLLAAPGVLRTKAQHLIGVLTERQVRATLQNRPVTDLRSLVGKSVRFGALADAGYRTVADVLAARPHELRAVPGIGPQTAEQVATAARRLVEEVRRETRVRFDPDRRSPDESRLLAVLAATAYADQAVATHQVPLRATTRRIARLVEEAEPTTSRSAMFFRGGEKKMAALAALAELDAFLIHSDTVSLRDTVSYLETAVDPASHPPPRCGRSTPPTRRRSTRCFPRSAGGTTATTPRPLRASCRRSCGSGSSPSRWTPACSSRPCVATRCSARSTRSTRSTRYSVTRWGSARPCRLSRP